MKVVVFLSLADMSKLTFGTTFDIFEVASMPYGAFPQLVKKILLLLITQILLDERNYDWMVAAYS